MSEDRLRVALTFDAEHPDRPHCPPGIQDDVVAVLGAEGIRATFFLQGRWVEAFPETARRIAAAGHLIGNHSFYHARMPLLSDEGIRTDVREAERAIREIAGADPQPRFRCPFGSGVDDRRVRGALRSLGYDHVAGNVEGLDWRPDVSADAVEDRVVRSCLDHPEGAVVLLHTWPETTARSLPGFVRRLRAEGATFVTVEDLA